MVNGSLLGLVETGSGVLEITHSFPFPDSKKDARTISASGGGDDDDVGVDTDFQLEMMRMLREVNVDNNCVGWYQSMYLGIYSTSSLLENQLSYQTDLSPNAVVVLYDPMQTAHGKLKLHCYRLTEECLDYKEKSKNTYIDPNKIFEEIPIKLTNPGLARALLADIVTDGATAATTSASLLHSVNTGSSLTMNADTTFDRLDLSTNPYLEKHLGFLCTWVDDLAAEQQKFQYYSRQLNQGKKSDWRNKNKSDAPTEEELAEGWASSTAPKRMEALLMSNQIRSYCNQMDKFAGGGLGKLVLAGGLQNEKQQTSSAEAKWETTSI